MVLLHHVQAGILAISTEKSTMKKTEYSALKMLHMMFNGLCIVLYVSAVIHAKGWAVIERIVDEHYVVFHGGMQQYERIVPLSNVHSPVPLEEGMWGYVSAPHACRNQSISRCHAERKQYNDVAANVWETSYILFRPSTRKTLLIGQRIAKKYATLRERRSVLKAASPLT